MVNVNWEELKEKLISETINGKSEMDFEYSEKFASLIVVWAEALKNRGTADENSELTEYAEKIKKNVIATSAAFGNYDVSEDSGNDNIVSMLYDRFLDAKSVKEKREVLQKLRPNLTDKMINDFAVILDVVVADSDYIDDRYYSLMKCLDTMARFETSGLR